MNLIKLWFLTALMPPHSLKSGPELHPRLPEGYHRVQIGPTEPDVQVDGIFWRSGVPALPDVG
jgi:hypothetical protein